MGSLVIALIATSGGKVPPPPYLEPEAPPSKNPTPEPKGQTPSPQVVEPMPAPDLATPRPDPAGEAVRQQVMDYYNNSLPCALRVDRTNPYKETFSPIKTQYIENILQHATQGPLGRSSAECDKYRNCLYKNVCLNHNRFNFFNPEDKFPQTGSYFYRDYLHANTFSWSYNINKIKKPPPTGNSKILKGRTLLMNPPFEFLPHSGHSAEVTFKLPALRKQFPGPINYLAAAHNSKMFVWSEQQFKIGFPDTNWEVPPYFHLNKIAQKDNLCFEELLVPAHAHFGFYSKEAANAYRENGLKMCNITPRKEYTPETAQTVFFLERGFNRQTTNGEDLCLSVRAKGFTTYRETVEDLDFCDVLKLVHAADIVVTGHGSHSNILPFINPGTVVIFATGKNFIVTEWDSQVYFSRGHILELYELRSDVWTVPPDTAYQGGDPMDPAVLQKLVDMDWIESHSFEFRAPARHLNTEVHPGNFENFFSYANSTLFTEKKKIVESCERPLKWPPSKDVSYQPTDPALAMFKQFSWSQNYLPCEPPEQCVCCKDASCSKLYHVVRPF